MGRTAFERLIHISYSQNTIDYWQTQPEEFKTRCDNIGKPFGYTGINVFVMFLYAYALVVKGEIKYRAFWKKGEPQPTEEP